MDVRAGEEGAVAITTALVLVALILIAGFLVDLGAVRADARTDQLLADSSLMAGASVDGDATEQCRTAVDFFAANISAGPVTASPHPCDSLPTSCDSSTAPVTTPPIIVGSYTIVVTHPVSDADAAMTVQDQSIADRDGDACDRMKFAVTRTRDFTFGAAGGAASSGQSAADAVARRRIEIGTKEYATLVVLDRSECGALNAAGGSQALVEDDLAAGHAGLISVDSDGTGSCSGANGYVMLTNGTNARVCGGVDPADTAGIVAGDPCSDPADGNPRIFTPARATESATLAYGRAALPADVDSFRVRTVPANDEVTTRAPGDFEWNCLTSYGTATASQPWLPTESDIDPCPDGNDPYIKEMASVLASGSGFTSLGAWQTHSGRTCDLSGTVGSTSENVFFDCDTVSVAGGATLRIEAQDYIVFRGNLEVSGTLVVDTGDDVVMVFQDGGMSTPGSPTQVVLERVAMYVHQPSFSGSTRALEVNLSKDCVAGTAPACTSYPVEWTAPEGPAHDDPDASPVVVGECVDLPLLGIPSPECFEDMALWSNADDRHILKGLMDVRGVFFTPNAGRDDNVPFDLSGGAAQPMRRAQFFSYRLEISGGSSILMRPDPTSILPTREVVATLIR